MRRTAVVVVTWSLLLFGVTAGVLTADAPVASAIGPAVDLGTLAGASSFVFFSQANDVNDRGQVVGWSLTLSDEPHAFTRSPSGTMSDLGTLGGRLSEATDVNHNGRVVGFSHTSFNNSRTHAFFWNGRMTDIGTLGGAESRAYGINNSDHIVGWADTSSGGSHAFLRKPVGGMIDLGTLGGVGSGAVAVNDADQVVGGSNTASGEGHAYIWDAVGGMRDLGTLGGASSGAEDVNAFGQVVGSSTTASGQEHAFIGSETSGMFDLGTLGGSESHAHGINDGGVVVGESTTAAGDTHAFAWDAVDGMVDLGTLGGPSSVANGVNDNGMIVGTADTLYHGEVFYHAASWAGPLLPPLVSLVTPPEGASYKQGQNVLANYSCSASSVSCVGTVSNNMPVDTSTPGPHQFTVTAIDGIGQSAAVTHSYTVKPDIVAPKTTLLTPAQGVVYALGTNVAASYSCTDPAVSSGLVSCAGDVGSNSPIDTNSLGVHTFTVSAMDGAGNVSSVVHTYHVVPKVLSIGDASVVEGDSGKPRSVRFPVTLSAPSDQPVTVEWSMLADGSASSDDLPTKAGSVTFQPSTKTGLTTTVRYVTIKEYPDTALEGDETFHVILSNPTGGYALERGVATGTILDDDPGTGLTVGVADGSIVEGSGGAGNAVKLAVSLSAPAPASVSVQVTLTDGTATEGDHDYKGSTVLTLVFQPGQWQKAVSVKVYPDVTVEPDEFMTVVLSSPSLGLSINRAVGLITIMNDD